MLVYMKSKHLILLLSFFFLSFKHRGPDWDVVTYNEIDSLGTKFSKIYELDYQQATSGGDDMNDVIWLMHFFSHNKLTLPTAEKLTNDLLSSLFSIVMRKECFSNWIKQSSKLSNYRYVELKPEFFGIKIGFWDENVNRPNFPYIAQILISGTSIKYYYADPITQALQDPIVKVYDYTDARLVPKS